MMRIRWTCLTALLLAATALGGCDNNKAGDENALLTEENESLRTQLSERNTALDSAYDENRQLTMQVSELRREIDDLQSAPASIPSGSTAFDNIPGVTGSMQAGEVTATIESDVLFDPGKATLKAAAKQALNAVADVLNSSYAGQPVRIGGHTDSDPIRKSGHKSNYHLGFERAFAVREYLVSRGVTTSRLYLASYGPDKPRDTKAHSRRVEIAVIVN
ncbi:MAG: OmpA/MotB family protein [Planctomycetota bacterium]|jgi:outer membrane protein OmpA-like peptidoglycan-associated protein